MVTVLHIATNVERAVISILVCIIRECRFEQTIRTECIVTIVNTLEQLANQLVNSLLQRIHNIIWWVPRENVIVNASFAASSISYHDNVALVFLGILIAFCVFIILILTQFTVI